MSVLSVSTALSLEDIPCFVRKRQDDGDNYAAVTCFGYNSGFTKATGMSLYEAMFGIGPFMAWGHAEAKRVSGEPYDLRLHFRQQQGPLIVRGKASRPRAAVQYDEYVKDVLLKEGDLVLVWSPDLIGQEGANWHRPRLSRTRWSGVSPTQDTCYVQWTGTTRHEYTPTDYGRPPETP